jgi:uncharacterized protein YfaS (alpha-2-macroglobulin family)
MKIYVGQTDLLYKCDHTDYIRDINTASYTFYLYKPNGATITTADLQLDGNYLLRTPTDENELDLIGKYGFQIEFTNDGKKILSETEFFTVTEKGK